MHATLKLSIIIPTLNEAGRIGELIRTLNHRTEGTAEIIIADGGSKDGTREAAVEEKAKVVECDKPGRAYQMNRGAEAAAGELYYFLHADTTPPEGFRQSIEKALDRGADAGCFQLKFDDPHPLLRFYSWFTRFNIDLLRFGDQSLFVKRRLFEATGGFDERLQLMEDQEMITRIRNAGGRFVLLKRSVTTSARKYWRIGIVRLQFYFLVIFLLYYLGVEQQTLTHLYRALISGKN